MTSYAIKTDLWDDCRRLTDSMGLMLDLVDVVRIDKALENCRVCFVRDLPACIKLDEELKLKHEVEDLFCQLPAIHPSLGIGRYAISPCAAREGLLRDRLGVQCKLVMKCGLAEKPADCVDVYI